MTKKCKKRKTTPVRVASKAIHKVKLPQPFCHCQIPNSKYRSSFESVGQILTRRLQHYTQNTFNNVDFSRNHGDIRVTWDVGGRSALSKLAAHPHYSTRRSI